MKVDRVPSRVPPEESSPRVLVSPALPGVRVIQLERSDRELMVFNDSYWVTHRVRTNNELRFREKRFFTPSHTVGVMEPDGYFRTGRAASPITVSIVMIDPSVVEHACAELGGQRTPRFGGVCTLNDPKLFGSLGQLVSMLSNDAQDAFEVESRFGALLSTVLRGATAGGPVVNRRVCEPLAMRRARDMMHENPAKKLTLKELAEEARINPYWFAHEFTRHFGIAPHAYQNQLRLARARRALETGAPPADVAVAAGFYDQSHFARLFKRSMGMTPATYARAFGRLSSESSASPVPKRSL